MLSSLSFTAQLPSAQPGFSSAYTTSGGTPSSLPSKPKGAFLGLKLSVPSLAAVTKKAGVDRNGRPTTTLSFDAAGYKTVQEALGAKIKAFRKRHPNAPLPAQVRLDISDDSGNNKSFYMPLSKKDASVPRPKGTAAADTLSNANGATQAGGLLAPSKARSVTTVRPEEVMTVTVKGSPNVVRKGTLRYGEGEAQTIGASTLRLPKKELAKITDQAYSQLRGLLQANPTAELPTQVELRFVDDKGGQQSFYMPFNPKARRELEAFRVQKVGEFAALRVEKAGLDKRWQALEETRLRLIAERERLEGAELRLKAAKRSLALNGEGERSRLDRSIATNLGQLQTFLTEHKGFTDEANALAADDNAFASKVAAARELPKKPEPNKATTPVSASGQTPTASSPSLVRRFLKLLNPFGFSLAA